MSPLLPTMVGALLGNLLLIAVFGFLYFKGRERHVLIWTWAWVLSTLRYVIHLSRNFFDPGYAGDVLFDFAVLGNGILLALGTAIYLERRLPKVFWWLMPPVAIWMFSVDFVTLPFAIEHMPGFFFLAIITAWTGASILRLAEPGLGKAITGWALISWGVHRADFPFLGDSVWGAPWGFMLANVLELFVAIGMLILYFEGARREAQDLHAQLLQAQKMEALGRVAGGIAHDFNNLLTVVRGNADLLAVESTSSTSRDLVNAISAAADRATGLTRQLLAFSRRQVLRTQVIDLRPLVDSTSQMLRRLIGEHIQLEVSLPDQPCHVRCDSDQLTQVILNLAINARDAMPRGGKLRIGLVCRVEESVLEVSDTGQGIPPEALPHIFEPFFTTKDIGKGTGLGLATVYGIIKQSGGKIEVESEVAAGTTFRVHLPRAKEPAAPKPEPKMPAADTKTGTILVVEDEQSVRDMVERVLSRAGYRVLTAASGPEALQIVSQHDGKIDVVLSDVVMPQMSGPQLAVKIAEQMPQTPVLLMSGYPDRITEETSVGPDTPLLAKPFTPETLLQAVSLTLEIRAPLKSAG